ncbi:MAG: hypothetical protein EXR86_13100 [Gammaproteobacteria bacterium]|nr:hypothetical protein [Gammaproteobacteria bacterium]
MMNKQFLGGAVLIAGSFAAFSASAVPLIDSYVGSNAYGHGDAIGLDSYFDIERAEVERGNGLLTVDVYTNFVGHVGVYPSATPGGIGYGDLFLGGHWTPFGNAGDKYASDNASNGTHWTYGLSFDDRWSTGASGTFTLYALDSLNNLDNVMLTDEFFGNNVTVRRGQAVAVDRSSSTVRSLKSGTWSIDEPTNRLTFMLDLSGLESLAMDEYLSLHWGMLCNNDAIEGGVELPSVPEPAVLSLLGLGLFSALTPRRPRKTMIA